MDITHDWKCIADSGDAAMATDAVNTIMGIPEGTLWGLASAIAFAVHLVRSEMRQHEAKDIGQLASGQLVVCGILSLAALAWQAHKDPLLMSEIDMSLIASVCSYHC